jgi:hypothetical protein
MLAGSARSTLLFGAKTPDGQFYAKDASRPLIFVAESGLVDDIEKPVDDWRPKEVFEFRTFSGTRFEVTRDGTKRVFEKQKAKDATAADTWAQTEPKPEKPFDSAKVEDFVSKMSILRGESFVDTLPKGAVQQAQAAAVWSDGKKQESVVFHKAGTDVLAVRGTEPGAMKLSTTDWDAAIKALDELK